MRNNISRRYDGKFAKKEDIYHPLSPIGIYGQHLQRETFCKIISENNIDLSNAEIFDLGCGKGGWCRFYAEIKGSTEGITGIDLDLPSLIFARKLSNINYLKLDMTDLSMFPDNHFDFVSAYTSFMFLKDIDEVKTVLKHIYRILKYNGHFLLGEVDQTHNPEKDFSGFEMETIIKSAAQYRLQKISHYKLFKKFFWNDRWHSYYRVGFRTLPFFRVIEKILPGKYTNYFLLFRKI